ncbi:MAG TPA: TetR/AcrR family transcriptional regulator C-terminal domain-containing protein [Jatrophihabitantaceae bacterium]|nr:TetR/AcrR family transcriptional regulator C-terminal domain-containing protein [Jatrophihabitantaceae bacterium]
MTRDRILAAALDLVDREGGQALTMRNLGRELQVEAMSLYHHVHNRADLLDGLADLLVTTGLPVAPADQPWEDALREFTIGIRRTARRHPAAFQLVGLRPLRSDPALRPVTALLARLETAGLSATTAVAVYRLAAAYARGFALAEIEGLTLAHPPTDPPGTSPALQAALREPNDRVFTDALQLILDSVRGSIAAR